jgi:hypothetical protein
MLFRQRIDLKPLALDFASQAARFNVEPSSDSPDALRATLRFLIAVSKSDPKSCKVSVSKSVAGPEAQMIRFAMLYRS